MEKFIGELEKTMSHFDEPDYFDVSENYSVVYHKFLSYDLSDRAAIRGQLEGPISFGFNILDQDERPILEKHGIDKEHMLEKSLLSPATCCLINPDKEKTVEKAFQAVKEISASLRSRYCL